MHRTLDSLKSLIADRYDDLPVCRPLPEKGSLTCRPDDEDRMFRNAMVDVRPLSKNRCLDSTSRCTRHSSQADGDVLEVMGALQRLVETGDGFVVASTPEYMEGTGPEIPAMLSRRLHRGDFAIQAHIDLHGLTARQARPVFDGFLEEAIAAGKRTVLIVHGRGLSSHRGPVLKECVRNWLSRSAWRRRVLAFASARSCDGGAGATVVLLRDRPLQRSRRK